MPRPPKQRTWKRLTRKAYAAGPPSLGGSGWSGGPLFVDAFQARRSPTPIELVEAFKQVPFACSALNQNGVARTRLGLYVTTGQGQARPKSWSCPTRPLRPHARAMLSASGKLTKSQIFMQKMGAAAEVDEVAEHVLLETIASINPGWDYDSWIRYTVACMDCMGWFFHLPEATVAVRGKSVPDTIWPLMAQYVFPSRVPGASLTEYYTYFGERYTPDQLIHGRFLSLRDPYGLGYGPMQAAFAYVGLADQYASLQENLFTQGGKVSGFLTDTDPDTALGKAEGARYEREINSTWTRGNAGKVKYIPANLKFQPAMWPPTDLAALDVSDAAVKMVCNCMGVPLSLIRQEDMSLASAEAGNRQHAELAIDPRCTLIASALTKWTRTYGREHGLDGWDRLYWAFDNPVAEDEERHAKIVDMQLKNGSLTINQANQAKGLPDVAWGDEPWFSNTLVQPSQMAEDRETAKVQAQAQAQTKPEGDDDGDEELDDEEDGPAAKSLSTKDMVDRAGDYGGGTDDGEDEGDDDQAAVPHHDVPEDHEDNTFGLPDGRPLRRELKRWYRRIARHVLGTLPTIGAPVPAHPLPLTDYADPMAAAMTPILSAYWDTAGKATRAKLGLDPEDWRVVDPNTHRMIVGQAHNFCRSTLATTTLDVQAAYDALRQELLEGIVAHGETGPELAKRVQRVFTDLSKDHAGLIARTEASRAVNSASLESARQSGVVEGKKWLASANSCPRCLALEKLGAVPLETPFATGQGGNATYATITNPPLHPKCRCTTLVVMSPEYQAIIDSQGNP